MFMRPASKEVCVVVISELEITFNFTIVDFVIIIYMYFCFVNEALFYATPKYFLFQANIQQTWNMGEKRQLFIRRHHGKLLTELKYARLLDFTFQTSYQIYWVKKTLGFIEMMALQQLIAAVVLYSIQQGKHHRLIQEGRIIYHHRNESCRDQLS